MEPINAKCWAQHSGLWMAEPNWLREAVADYRAGRMPTVAQGDDGEEGGVSATTADSIAVIDMSGPMVKGRSKFPAVNMLAVEQFIRAADRESSLKVVVLSIDSPGGTVRGTDNLAAAVAKSKTPILVHASDRLMSAALYVGSQASKVFASPSTEVGSIGVFGVIDDTSGKMEAEGIKVHLITTGEFKGAGTDGVPITDRQLAEFQKITDAHGEQFVQAVARGRKMEVKAVRALADGRTWMAEEARKLGLIDKVQSFDDTIAFARRLVSNDRARRRVAAARVAAAG